MRNKRQHIIPKCYLRAWCDENCPSGQEPYIWLISKDGSEKKKKAPKKTFTETDMYTIRLPDGVRDLSIEDTLSHIETSFVRLLNNRIRKHLPLSDEERAQLCIFTAAMFSRTKAQQKDFQDFFRNVHDRAENMEKQHNAPPKTSLETKIWYDYAHQLSIAQILQVLPPMFYKMSLVILETNDDLGFITSDRPCVWFNPEAYKWSPFYRHPGLGQPKIEITLPLSPNYLLFFSWRELQGYLPIPIKMVDELNRRTRGFCEEYFVSKNIETKSIWFEMGEMPDDAWEKVHKNDKE